MIQRSTIVLFVLLLSIISSWSQQNDCVRNDCFVNRKVDPSQKIEVEQKGVFSNEVYVSVNPILIDIDNDCVPELFIPNTTNYGSTNDLSNSILVYDSKSRNLIHQIPTYHFPGFQNCYTILKTANSFELIVFHPEFDFVPDSIKNKIVCYRPDGSIKWISDSTLEYGFGRFNISLADFNMDGIPEVYISNVIFNAHTGIKLADGGQNGIGGKILSFSTVAADLDDDPNDLELAAGYTIYKVKITNTNGMAGNEMIPYNIEVDGKKKDGVTAIADINRDGKLDVIVGNFEGVFFGPGTLYVYTLVGNQCVLLAKIDYANTGEFGLPAIGNVSNEHESGIVFFSGSLLHKLSYNNAMQLTEDWTIPINDFVSINGVSLFDFDNDGIHEIVYRDEKELVILNAQDDKISVIYRTDCSSGTLREYPIIADLTNEGTTSICVSCGRSPMDRIIGQINLFGPTLGNKWSTARNIWHQNGYNPLFINDDGTIPQHQHNHATYRNGRYNNFNAQEAIVDIPAASLYGEIGCVEYDVATDRFTVRFTISNRVDASTSAPTNIPVAFYTGNPERGGRLIGVYHTTSGIHIGENTGTLSYTFPASGVTSLWMVVNTDKFPIVLNDDASYFIDECDYADNIYTATLPKIENQKEVICSGETLDFYGQKLKESGQYNAKVASKVTGCDSLIAILDLEIYIKTAQIHVQACDIYNLVIGRDTFSYTTSGERLLHYKTSTGCDSLVNMNLTILKSTESLIEVMTCDAYQFFGSTLTESGLYQHTLTNSYGCDSTITLDLRRGTISSQTTTSACGSYYWAEKDTTITTSGTYSVSFDSHTGCDSVITIAIQILPEYDQQIHEEACGNFTWSVSNESYRSSGIYSQLLKTAQGCDSLITLDLVIHPKFEFHDTVSTTTPYYWPLNGQTYDQSGVYIELFHSEASCDSLHTLHLSIQYSTDIFFPNVMSVDSHNGFFTGFSKEPGTLIKTLSIFDRWGNRVFHKEHFAANEPEAGWNGKLGGRAIIPGVYIWVAQVVHRDGREETFSGDVTLVR